MSHDVSTIARSSVLANSAAEFLETRAREALGVEIAESGSPQYVPVRDQFVASSEIESVDYHAESAAKLKKLETTLQKFAVTIKERNFDEKLQIVLKDPTTYNMSDVLSIAEQIQEKHRDADKVKSAMGLIRKCFRFTEDHHGQLKRLLKFVPNDTYGTVISGSFTMILGAVERADNLRTDIYEALANIPMRLREVENLADVHYHSAELQQRADSVFVAIFVVLEGIVNELTKSMARKGVSLIFKGDKHSFDLTEAFNDLEKQLKEFRVQVEICFQQRFDIQTRFDKFQQRCLESQEMQEHRLETLGQALLEPRSTPTPEVEQVKHERLQTVVYNTFYVFLTGNPNFDAQTGRLDLTQAMKIEKEMVFPVHPEDVAFNLAKRNKKTVKNWFEYLQPVHHCPKTDINECFQSFGMFSSTEKDKIQWILTSDEIHSWLQAPQSAALIVEPQTYPEGIFNPLSFTCAFIAGVLNEQDVPIICWFAGVRANESMREDESGPGAMLASLFAQLMVQARKRVEGVKIPEVPGPNKETYSDDNAVVASKKLHKTSSRAKRNAPPSYSNTVANLKELILRLIEELPARTCVFVVLDSMVHLTGIDAENNKAVSFIIGLAEDERLVFKILATGVFSLDVLESVEHATLFLPDVTNMGSHDINPAFYEGSTIESIELMTS
ncbi:hypothetical protein K458DRAFT_435517 [Lentithecium fluviatile CBS 122367]|uniref:Uncharacterized protein n=1 Tax=Lentithecium fluviatile CBS 122367 TaxID=1168545 RepID=A0A6G1IKT1_9PLEO|nr:hypothetical protein K458DRAFT_435517 [Lentithecium fluviatile CBS 122367]